MTPLGPEALTSVLTLDDFELLARDRLSEMAYAYLAGGAGSEVTVAENRAAFNRIRLYPRVLVDASQIETGVTLFGRDYPFPILLAPTGYHMLFHPEGERETVEGANLGEATLVASLFSSVRFAKLSSLAKRPLWFQLYIQNDREFTKDIVEEVLSAGCEAICVTVDEPLNGPRDREFRAGFKLPAGIERANLARLGSSIAAGSHRPSGRNIYSATHGYDVTWKDIDWLRRIVPARVLLKGVLHPADARRAVEAGCDGVIVSNHGGRSLDTVPATIDALPPIVQAIEGRVPILLDGGIRRGIDIFKALAKGAAAVLIGRPYIYGLAVGGSSGIARIIEILRTELEMTMGLAGCPRLSEIGEQFLF